MAHLYKALEPKATYADRQFRGTADEYSMALANSTTIYVGNLSFFTTEECANLFFVVVLTSIQACVFVLLANCSMASQRQSRPASNSDFLIFSIYFFTT